MAGGLDLKMEVLSSSTCTLCGACLDWCPYLKNLEDHLVMRFDCGVTDGRCYATCPRTFTDWQEIEHEFLPDAASDLYVGASLKVVKVKGASVTSGQQDGGTVSALLRCAQEEKEFSAALLTGSADGITPQPFLARSLEEIQAAAGSRYLAAPGLRFINDETVAQDQLLVVGRPCQIQALRKRQRLEAAKGQPREYISIGLFCTWQLGWDFKDYLLERYPGQKPERIAIPQHGLEVTVDGKQCPVPMDDVRRYIRPACGYCLDMCAELADISVGALEAEPGWNVAMIRSQKGKELFELAVQRGYLIVEDYAEEEFARLKGASLNKKARNLNNLRQAAEQGRLKPFVDLDKDEYKQIMELAEGKVKQ
ncbi:MAG: Coenzyme F420 hydrogenase/dehydrogenase, beta subunit C-terminal domain [Syntrophomonadaceae bacterium]|nr:Coenzyme F420 hydrogenase/dehydrogenase, beta subunit C-terminal domain [Syntrophomonadaceae bacterium]